MRIGLFDSGVGGLTVLRTLRDKYPNNEYIYYGDTKNLPYGIKTKKELNKLSSHNIEFLIDKKVDMIIIACGTVSSNCIDYLKDKYNIPIYDIITPTIEYLNKSNYQNIGVIATNATINSHIFKSKLNKNTIEIATPKFVPLIEQNKLDNINIVIDEYLNNYQDKLDALVLGCTHYPIIKDNIESYLNNNIKIIDMSAYLLPYLKDGDKSNTQLYFTKLDDNILSNVKRILKDNYIIKEEK